MFNRTSIISVRNIGHHVTDSLLRLGYATRFFALTLLNREPASAALRLIIRELYFSGVLSMIIILVSGLFVGMVLGFQGYQTLKLRLGIRAGSAGGAVAGARAGPGDVGAALCEPRRVRDDRRDRPDEGDRAVVGDGNDGGGSDRARCGAALLGRLISMPLLAAMFSAMGVYGGYLIGVVVIGVDEGSFWSQMQSAVDFREDIVNGVIKSVVFGIAVTWIALFEGYDAPPTAEGVSGATTRTVVTSHLRYWAWTSY